MDQHRTRLSPERLAISVVVALLIAAVLQFAAAAKLIAPSADPSKAVSLPGLAEPVQRDTLIAIAEMVILMLVLVAHRWKVTWAGVAIMFAGFTGYAAYRAYRNEDCGCFGDLWVPPKGLTLTLDIAFAIAGLCLAFAWGLRKRTLGPVCLAMVVASVAGLGFAHLTATPTAEEAEEEAGGRSVFERLADAAGTDVAAADFPDLHRAFNAEPGDPAHYIFLHDPGCHTCEEMKIACVDADDLMLEQDDDEFMQVQQHNVFDMRDALGIEDYAWPNTPTVVVVRDGQILHHWSGEGAPCPGSILTAGTPEGAAGVYEHLITGDLDALRALGTPDPH